MDRMASSPVAFHPFSPRNQLVLAAGFCLYAGIVLHNPLLVFVGALAATCLVQAALRTSRTMRQVSVRRIHGERAFEGQALPVTLEVQTQARGSTSLLIVTDSFPPASNSRVQRLIESPLTRRNLVALDYRAVCDHRRGAYLLGPVRMEAMDDLGLVRREALIDLITPLTVLPTSVDLRQAEVLGEGALPHVGIETTRRAGMSEEFVGLREYRPGDPPNALHWRSTARQGRPIVKEFREEVTTDVSIFIDLNKLGLTGVGDQTTLEYAIKGAASIAKRAVSKAHAVQVFGVGARVEHVPLGTGTGHLLFLLDRLAFLKVEGASDFARGVRAIAPTLRPGGTAVLFQGATTVDVDAMAPLVALLRRRHILPIIVLIDDRAFIKLYIEQETQHVRAASLEEVVRFFTLEGARVHVLTRATSREDAMLDGLERPAMAPAGEGRDG